jgi:hypothetical protein
LAAKPKCQHYFEKSCTPLKYVVREENELKVLLTVPWGLGGAAAAFCAQVPPAYLLDKKFTFLGRHLSE